MTEANCQHCGRLLRFMSVRPPIDPICVDCYQSARPRHESDIQPPHWTTDPELQDSQIPQWTTFQTEPQVTAYNLYEQIEENNQTVLDLLVNGTAQEIISRPNGKKDLPLMLVAYHVTIGNKPIIGKRVIKKPYHTQQEADEDMKDWAISRCRPIIYFVREKHTGKGFWKRVTATGEIIVMTAI